MKVKISVDKSIKIFVGDKVFELQLDLGGITSFEEVSDFINKTFGEDIEFEVDELIKDPDSIKLANQIKNAFESQADIFKMMNSAVEQIIDKTPLKEIISASKKDGKENKDN